MKKFLIIIVAGMFTVQLANAQTQKGSQALGANLAASYSSNTNATFVNSTTGYVSTNTKTTGFSIGPNYSYFVADNLDLGGSFTYGASSSKDSAVPSDGSGTSKQNFHSFGGSVYMRKYFMYKNIVGVRTGPYVSYTKGNGKTTYTGTIPSVANSTVNTAAGLGFEVVYYPSKRLGVSASLANLQYTHSNDETQNVVSTKADNLNLNFVTNGLQLTLFFVFGAK